VAGYSGKTITEKIGAKPGQRVYIDGLPEAMELLWPAGVQVLRRLPAASVDIAWCFCANRDRLEARVDLLVTRIAVDGALWVSWPKKSSGTATDLDDSVVRTRGLAAGVGDGKGAAGDHALSHIHIYEPTRR
jgi:hypothetical protein